MAYIYMTLCESPPARMEAHWALQNVNAGPDSPASPNAAKVQRVFPALWGPHVVSPGDVLNPFYGIYIHDAV